MTKPSIASLEARLQQEWLDAELTEEATAFHVELERARKCAESNSYSSGTPLFGRNILPTMEKTTTSTSMDNETEVRNQEEWLDVELTEEAMAFHRNLDEVRACARNHFFGALFIHCGVSEALERARSNCNSNKREVQFDGAFLERMELEIQMILRLHGSDTASTIENIVRQEAKSEVDNVIEVAMGRESQREAGRIAQMHELDTQPATAECIYGPMMQAQRMARKGGRTTNIFKWTKMRMEDLTRQRGRGRAKRNLNAMAGKAETCCICQEESLWSRERVCPVPAPIICARNAPAFSARV